MGCRSLRARRWILFQTDPHCHWCGIEVRFIHNANPQPPDVATVDHIAFHGNRRHHPTVLACFTCNQFRERLKAVRKARMAGLLTERQMRALRREREVVRLQMLAADVRNAA